MSRHDSTPRAAWNLVRNDPVAYLFSWSQWVLFHMSPLVVGYLLKLVLDRLDVADPQVPVLLLVAILGAEVGRWTLLVSAAVQWHGAWVGWLTVPRVNALSSLATGGGPVAGRLPGSPGEAVSRFRDDTQDISLVLDVWLDVSGAVAAASVALVVMFSIDPLAAGAALLPVAVAVAISAALGPVLRTWRRDAREATASVTGFIGDTFGGILAVKTNAAESAVDTRFAALNASRAVVGRRDALGSEVIRSLGYGTGEVAVGVVLLLVASSLRSGELSIGDIGLFASYVPIVAGLPRWIGRLGVYHRQADVSVDRLAELMPVPDRHAALRPVRTHLRHGPPPMEPTATDGGRLQHLAVEGLTVRHLGSGRGVTDIDLDVRRGELVVLTGPVGSGKTTTLRAILGLVPRESGTITWNGVVVDDPALSLVPPRTAYLPQVPRLFSESLADTILLGHPDHELERALRLACLDEDLAGMADGPRTVIGPRGLRLSGGQIQRTGAARALVRRPELLVVDDLSSALDVETERELWRRMVEDATSSVLMVSHRPHVLEMASRIVTLDAGRVADVVEQG
ncbi:ATP-binding cassette domain-containing protein [Actinomarinicola tropica]|uniref:ATP-binding cassette domain-containing protein n=1 Tax=Actinomarinicola tropica TaxID=2789776 RepID=A0A5Q2RKZ1_9ACTN|nr:ABC transporter ATP-binding protein [Actinomarinicola tropica]QGG96154.1 ATP-binding cassette domain-containing protein [Actinomarinicola tropica]